MQRVTFFEECCVFKIFKISRFLPTADDTHTSTRQHEASRETQEQGSNLWACHCRTSLELLRRPQQQWFCSGYEPAHLLVSGNECGRVFPAGVGPGSPSRDAANWLPSRFSLSVETRRRYGWLRMMVFPGARLFPSPNLVPFGRVAARERQGALSRRAW